MLRKTLELLRCPVDRAPLALERELLAGDRGETVDGVLRCPGCRRWFRIEQGIPDLVADGLREWADERAFLSAHRAALGPAFFEGLAPDPFSGAEPARTPEERRVVEEGRHWGRFMRHFHDVDDGSIFDMDVKGRHPRFYVAGLLERDDRDARRRHSFFPTAAGNVLFGDAKRLRGRRALDVGTGGGQFALKFAKLGLDVLGMDPSFEEVSIAREVARKAGVWNVDYVRAAPDLPPFAPAAFGVLLAKDALHHVPELGRVLDEALMPLLEQDAELVVQEHVGKSRAREWFGRRVAAPLIPKIRASYANVPIPQELLRDSANEDVSMHAVVPELEKRFRITRSHRAHWFYLSAEALVYFAHGKRRGLAWCAKAAAWTWERAVLLTEPGEFWCARGVRRRP
ncbi:MAG: methyltransferase domain-containing protein [Candidatus Sumerlaeia bacterium]|nr:methyltransferase domain-containing protein [Candidatus Sumerlaeia bacterium]